MTRLSKSRIMSARQCPKRAHLETHHPGLAVYSAATEAAFRQGHEVGALAARLYGQGQGTLIEWSGGTFAGALALTDQLMSSMIREPVFEATLRHQDVLVREDVLLPAQTQKGPGWKMVEVKASTKLKQEHIEDCAIQAWVHLGAGHALDSISLAHVDRDWVYPGGGDYSGIFQEEDLTEQAFSLLPSVPLWVEAAREAVSGPMPDVPVGGHCRKPYECPFMDHCWPTDARYPIRGLGGGARQLGAWVAAGYRDIRDVPPSEIDSEQQARIRRVTAEGRAELLPGARAFVRALPYPRYHLDFETVSPAIPVWPGTRPYQVLPFQWSIHVERSATTEPEHREFLLLDGAPPMRPLAEALIEACGDDGPVLMYTRYEAQVIDGLISLFPDLAEPLQAIADRLVDLHPVTRDNYYHPDMLGSWSIKAVLPTIAPDMDYAALEGVHEGTEASAAYFEAIDPETTPERKLEIETQLRRYCRHDTEAMVRLVRFLGSESRVRVVDSDP